MRQEQLESETFSAREEKVVRMRFGLEDGSEHTLGEVGLEFAVTRERICNPKLLIISSKDLPVGLRGGWNRQPHTEQPKP
jgi:hypothetical protein